MHATRERGEGRIVVVCGPTATGKTALALRLARELDGEIVNADSRQVYRYMDIGTAKPSPKQRAFVPHHLLDVVDPDEPFTLADYLERARAAVADIVARGHVPIVAGGTGLYIRALVQGFDVPRVAPNRVLRLELECLAASEGVGALLERLRCLDPRAAATVDKENPRRLIRAIEVAEARVGADAEERFLGAPALPGNDLAASPEEPRGYDALLLGLSAERTVLRERADRRVDAMMAAGFLDEVRQLFARAYAPDLPALSGLGYRELGEHLRGERTLDDAVQATKWATHRFIRRQLTWFRREQGVTWLDITTEDYMLRALRLAAQWLSAPTVQAVGSA